MSSLYAYLQDPARPAQASLGARQSQPDHYKSSLRCLLEGSWLQLLLDRLPLLLVPQRGSQFGKFFPPWLAAGCFPLLRPLLTLQCFRTQENYADCQLGSFRNLLVSPSDIRINEQTGQPEIVQSSPDLRPLAVLLQPQPDSTGTNRLQDVQRKLLQRLNQLQLHDCTQDISTAEPFLSAFADHPFTLVIAGNDKRVGQLSVSLCRHAPPSLPESALSTKSRDLAVPTCGILSRRVANLFG